MTSLGFGSGDLATRLYRRIRGLVQRDGTWVLSLTYRPWGAVLDSAGTQHGLLRYRWTGREFDAETGLYFHRTRYYSPAARRFVQEDVIGYAGGSNLYAYVGGQVLEATDPSGLIWKHEDGGSGSRTWTLDYVGRGRYDGGFDLYGWSAGLDVEFYNRLYSSETTITYDDGSIQTININFEGSAVDRATMQNWWTHVGAVLSDGSKRGVLDAAFTRSKLSHAARSGVGFTFRSGVVTGVSDFGSTVGTTMTIDLADIMGSGSGVTTIGAVMIHEFGHAYYTALVPKLASNWDDSNAWALTFENAYRRSAGFNTRPSHSGYPPLH